jgi:hypothetical protein
MQNQTSRFPGLVRLSEHQRDFRSVQEMKQRRSHQKEPVSLKVFPQTSFLMSLEQESS